MVRVGILAFHGDVIEHARITEDAAKKIKRAVKVALVRTKKDLKGLDALIIPGGESPTLQKLCEREGMFPDMKKIRNIFGTCAGAILLARKVRNKTKDQRTLALMDIEVARNAYGRQTESFEKRINTTRGPLNAVFIRAPKITKVGKSVAVLSKGDVVACEQRKAGAYYLALAFHPELTTTKFHEYFLEQV
jgi:5'-phosphate synthase pdxT subunit